MANRAYTEWTQQRGSSGDEVMYAEAVACGAHGTKELQLRVRTGVAARGARLNTPVLLQVSFLRSFSSSSFSRQDILLRVFVRHLPVRPSFSRLPCSLFVRHFQLVHFQRPLKPPFSVYTMV